MALCFPIAALMASLLAQDTQMTREGNSWTLTETGTVTGAPMVKISTRGSVVVRGSQGDQIQYKLTKRVRARDPNVAHGMMGSTTISTSLRGRTETLVVAPAIRNNVITQLEVTVPRGITALEVYTQLGDVEAYDMDCNVHADTTAGQIRCDRIRGFVEGNTGGGEIHMGKIGGAVRCVSAAGSIFVDSAGGEASCQTAGGEIQVHDGTGPMTLVTEGGNIQVDRAGSTVEAHTGQGVIEITQAGGMVLADTRGGSIQVGSARGVKCQSAAGTIRVKTLSGPLKLQTAMGSILAELLSGARIEDASLIAGSGDITVLIPSNLALSLVARNDTGGNPRIVSDFSELRPKAFPMTRPQLVYEGSLNGGGPLMTINTGSGIIYVRKLK
jgi:DUF4097 and DUF4098 domain-containing protein YvlB